MPPLLMDKGGVFALYIPLPILSKIPGFCVVGLTVLLFFLASNSALDIFSGGVDFPSQRPMGRQMTGFYHRTDVRLFS